MKFCKNLQKVVEISDPEWTPFWPNYKMLKKLIKELPSLIPTDQEQAKLTDDASSKTEEETKKESSRSTKKQLQKHGDETSEVDRKTHRKTQSSDKKDMANAQEMTQSPGEVAFFKMLHAELRKASYFFERATVEFSIREERVREGMNIMKQPNSIMVNEKWVAMARSIYRLYKDLLLLETFAIMAYCAFSKILKKHDKMTGYATRGAFMMNLVNKQNFTDYPEIMVMIKRCEILYEEVSKYLLEAGKSSFLEDERLFINMIHRLNEQVLSTDKDEVPANRVNAIKRPASLPTSERESMATSAVRALVEEIKEEKSCSKVASSNDGSEEESIEKKRRLFVNEALLARNKKQRLS